MIRMRDSKNPSAGYHYFSKSDAGLEASGLRSEVGGNGAKLLGLAAEPDFDQFRNLLHGLHPKTGEQLTAKLVDDRISYWDITASVPKGVTVALERGDSRVQEAIWDAGRETLAEIEAMTTTRKRKGGEHADRVTGNLVWFGFEHPETRPAKSDGMPDPDRHIHFVVPNVTYDPVEHEWKAVKFRPVMDLRKYFDRGFDARLAAKLTDLGYGIEARYRADGAGGKRFYTWDVADMPKSVVDKFSRRTHEVEALAEKLGITGPGKDKLGATSRQFKRDDMTLDDYRRYWDSRVTPDEARAVAEVIKAAIHGQNPRPGHGVRDAVDYSLSHHFERQSVVPWQQVAVTALEKGMGAVRPDEVMPEAKRQGLLLKDGKATTKGVLAEEDRVIAFARNGRGACRPMGLSQNLASNDADKRDMLSPEQLHMVNHVLTSKDRLMLVVGDAGTGKTHAVKDAFARIDRPAEILAPGAEASRGVLRRDGFTQADTVTAFLGNQRWQQAVKNGVVWIDEAGQLPIRDLSRLVDVAREQNARLVLQGDPKQHRSVARDGNMLRVLERYAGLPVARLKDIRRQKGDYKTAVGSLRDGRTNDGLDQLHDLGWVKQVDDNRPLVDAYLEAAETRRSDQDITDRVLAVAPTHAEANEVTAAIRERLKEKGMIGTDEHRVPTLVPRHWSDAEKGDAGRFDGTEVIQFHRNGGTFKAGDRVAVKDFKPGQRLGKPSTFAVYAPSTVGLAAGDRIRITANGWTADKKHRLDNGSQYTVAGFLDDGAIRLDNGWYIGPEFKHLSHGYVATSHASQGKTVDRVLIAMGHESMPAVNREQLYVSVSRGRERATIFTDVSPERLKEAVTRTDDRIAATELMRGGERSRMKRLLQQGRELYRRLRDRVANDNQERQITKERGYER